MRRETVQKIKTSAFFVTALLGATMLLLGSCSQEIKQPITETTQQKIPAKVTVLYQLAVKDKPRVTMLSEVPAPTIINLPTASKATDLASETDSMLKARISFSDSNSGVFVEKAKGKGFFSTLTTDDGLNLDQVYSSFKDRWGNLWFGTNGGGVSKYDGKTFTTYTTAHGLPSNVIWCINQDHQGNLWFGTDGGGVSKYDGESFVNYSTAQGLADNIVFSIAEDKEHNLWFGTLKGGVSKWNGKAFINYTTKDGLANNGVKSVFPDSKGNLWFCTLGGGVSEWNGKSFTNYNAAKGLANEKVWSAAEDNAGNLWFGTEGKGLSKWNGQVFTNYDLFDESTNDVVLCIKKDTQGCIWAGTQYSGVLKNDGKKFIKYTTTNGLANNHIRTITEDAAGNLWFGSFGSGVSKFSGAGFTNFTKMQGLPGNVIYSIEEDEGGNLWFATTDGGIGRYDGKSFKSFTKKDGLASNEINCVLRDRSGALWFGVSAKGVTKYDGKSFTNYSTTQGLAGNLVFSIAEDKSGNLWFGTASGVSKFDGQRFTNYTSVQGLASNAVFSIKEDEAENLWFGTLGGGVSKFDGQRFTNYTSAQGLSDNTVWAIAEDKQRNLWFGTQHGLNLMRGANIQSVKTGNTNQNIRQPLFTSFTTEDGLPDNFITQVLPANNEMLYIGTNLGMCELLPAANKSTKGWLVGRVFNTRNGYPVKDVNAGPNAMFRDSKGRVWVATGSDKTGLVRFEPNAAVNGSGEPPRVFINQIKLNNEGVSWRDLDPATGKENEDSAKARILVTDEINVYGKTLATAERDSIRQRFSGVKFNGIAKWQALPRDLVVPYAFNKVGFIVGAVETDRNFLVNYSYFLEGYDKAWSPPTRNNYVDFGNIFEGRYTLKVKAQSPEGVWSEPVTYTFTVLPPWWRTWWMLLFYIAFIFAAVFLFVWWRHRQLMSQKAVLKHKVAIATRQVREEAEKVRLQKKEIENALAELKATQSQLIQSEKMASLGQLTAGIAHEIQNPLNFVNNFSEVSNELINELENESEKGNAEEVKAIVSSLKQNLEKISQHGRRADAIVKGMLQHSRLNAGTEEPTNINALCAEYLRLSYLGLRAKDKNLEVETKTAFDESIGEMLVVSQDIGRVLLNLFNNAFYAVRERQRNADGFFKPTVSVETKKNGHNVMIKVSDNGKGIPSAIIGKIFQPFFTTKPSGQGTGLGLSLAYDIVNKEHGGKLTVESKEGMGTTFIIQLPQKLHS